MNDIQKAIETQKNIYDALCRSLTYSDSVATVCIPVYRMEEIKTAISAMQELQQYRQIGTPEECREARRKQEPKEYKLINSVRCCPELKKILQEIEKESYSTNTDYGHSVVVNMDSVAKNIHLHMAPHPELCHPQKCPGCFGAAENNCKRCEKRQYLF